MLDCKAILTKAQDPTYTPPITLQRLGVLLFEANESPQVHWPDAVRRGWLWALRASAWADGAAYMVGNGQVVSL